MASRLTLRAARMRAPRRARAAACRGAGVAAGLGPVMNASSFRRMRPFSAPVTSMTASSIASSSCVDLVHRHQLLAELVELAEAGELLVGDVELRLAERRRGAARLAAPARGRCCGSSNMLKESSTSPSVTPVAVDEARAALLLAVDEDLGLLVDLFEVEVAPVEEDLRVRLGEPVAGEGDVVAERAADRRHRLVEHERPRRTLGRKPLEDGHRRARAWRAGVDAGRPLGRRAVPPTRKALETEYPKTAIRVDLGARANG